jgi:hypothetical protein
MPGKDREEVSGVRMGVRDAAPHGMDALRRARERVAYERADGQSAPPCEPAAA